MNSKAPNPNTPMITAVLFISCCGVSSETFPSISGSVVSISGLCVFEAGFGSCAAMAALWIGFEGWLLGGFFF